MIEICIDTSKATAQDGAALQDVPGYLDFKKAAQQLGRQHGIALRLIEQPSEPVQAWLDEPSISTPTVAA